MLSGSEYRFITFAHDLKPPDALNYLLKYADDSSLLSPQSSPTPVELEMNSVMDCARENKMSLNLLRTVELVSRRRHDVSRELLGPYRPYSQTESEVTLQNLWLQNYRHFVGISITCHNVWS